MPHSEMKYVTVPLGKDDDVDGFNLGDTVSVVITGVVERMEAAREYDYGPKEKGEYPPELGVKVSAVKVKGKTKAKTKMDKLNEEED